MTKRKVVQKSVSSQASWTIKESSRQLRRKKRKGTARNNVVIDAQVVRKVQIRAIETRSRPIKKGSKAHNNSNASGASACLAIRMSTRPGTRVEVAGVR